MGFWLGAATGLAAGLTLSAIAGAAFAFRWGSAHPWAALSALADAP